MIPGWKYKDTEISLSKGDRLISYTDGVTEAENGQSEEFGPSRLLQAVHGNASSASDAQREVMKQVGNFCNRHFRDDVSLIVAALR